MAPPHAHGCPQQPRRQDAALRLRDGARRDPQADRRVRDRLLHARDPRGDRGDAHRRPGQCPDHLDPGPLRHGRLQGRQVRRPDAALRARRQGSADPHPAAALDRRRGHGLREHGRHLPMGLPRLQRVSRRRRRRLLHGDDQLLRLQHEADLGRRARVLLAVSRRLRSTTRGTSPPASRTSGRTRTCSTRSGSPRSCARSTHAASSRRP